MCEHGTHQLVRVRIPRDLAAGGRAKWKRMKIDACIAPLVAALQQGGINMRGSCCCHGHGPGNINLQDGRVLLILDAEAGTRYIVNAGKRTLKEAMMAVPRWVYNTWLQRGVYYARFAIWWIGALPCWRCDECKRTKPIRVL